MRRFAKNKDVVFGDVNLSQESIRGPYNPGAGGWPTVRAFNKKTGLEGAPYSKKTNQAMCDELGQDSYMEAYVTEAASTSLCNVHIEDLTDSGCTDKEVEYAFKWRAHSHEEITAQAARLQSMKASEEAKKLKPAQAAWINHRLAILQQLLNPPPVAATAEL